MFRWFKHRHIRRNFSDRGPLGRGYPVTTADTRTYEKRPRHRRRQKSPPVAAAEMLIFLSLINETNTRRSTAAFVDEQNN